MEFTSRNFADPENIFHFINKTLDSLCFVLDWDTDNKFYYNLLRMSFGEVLNEPDEHSMVLAKSNESTYFHCTIPAFDIKYIQDCFDSKDFQDPSKYLIKSSCPVQYTRQDIIDCLIHQTKCWSDLIPIQNNDDDDDDDDEIGSKISLDSCSSSDLVKTNLNISVIPKIHSNDEDDRPDSYNPQYTASSSSSTLSRREGKNSNDEDNRPDSNNKPQFIASSPSPLSRKERKNSNDEDNRPDSNRKRQFIASSPSPLSRRERKNLNDEDNRPDSNRKRKFIASSSSTLSRREGKNSNDEDNRPDSNRKPQFIASSPSPLSRRERKNSNDEDNRPHSNRERQFIASSSSTLSRREGKKSNDEDDWSNSKRKPQFTSSSSSMKGKKKTRFPYSHKEDVNIVKYIVENKYAFNITGVRMWQEMERANVCKIRTWQSMKNRYLKCIKYELNSGSQKYPFLSKDDLKMLRQGLNIDMIKDKDKLELKNKFQNDWIEHFSDDSS